MGAQSTLSSNGAVVPVSCKISIEMNKEIEMYSREETKYNRSEMIRILITEALDERKRKEKIIEGLELEEINGVIE